MGTRWVRVDGVMAVVAGTVLVLATGCGVVGGGESCDEAVVAAFRELPAYEGVEVDLHGSPGIGCTDTVRADDPAAFVAHYEKAMADSGWTVARDGSGVFGRSDVGGLRFDPLEGNSVGVYALSPDEYGG